MALAAPFQAPTDFGHGPSLLQDFLLSNHLSFIPDNAFDSAIEDYNLSPGPSDPTSPQMDSLRPMPEFVEPQDLLSQEANVSTSSPAAQVSPRRRTASIVSTASSGALRSQQLLRRMSLAGVDLEEDSYRPRNTPARRKKSTTGRIRPRSDKHARELELNRKAATKCRTRQKAFIDQLQQKCRREEERMHIQSALVSALHDEVTGLRNEIMRQSVCGCRFLSRASLPISS